jgi:hypothetical protein
MAVWVLRTLFGILCLPAFVLLLLTPFMFDNPAAEKNPYALNLAVAPVIYLLLFVVSLVPIEAPNDAATAPRAKLIRALLPLVGVAWYGIALLLMEVMCDGKFSCR